MPLNKNNQHISQEFSRFLFAFNSVSLESSGQFIRRDSDKVYLDILLVWADLALY
jgi:hypothetical protein